MAAASPAKASAAAGEVRGASALLVFLPSSSAAPASGSGRRGSAQASFEAQLADVKGFSVGIMSASQGRYTTAQLVLDITQGARIASSAYSSSRPPALSLKPAGAGAVVEGWPAARRRAEDAPQLLRPGLLATWIAGGSAGYAGIPGGDGTDGAVAADREGHIASLTLGPSASLLARIAALRRTVPFVVADLPGGAEGRADLRELAEIRPPEELLIVVQRAPEGRAGELLWTAVAGLPGGGDHELTSRTTREHGLIASIDIAPTILERLRVRPMPAGVRGAAIETDGTLHSASLRGLMSRLRVIGGRRLKALGLLLAAWVLLLGLSAPWPRARAVAMRSGALGVLWAPLVVLLPAAIEPGAASEYAMIAAGCVLLGALTDRLLPWPRALIAPALVTVIALVVDALAGTQLLMRALLGPNPALGARFYGIGNELKSGLAVLVLAAVAAALYPAARGRLAAGAMALAGLLLAVVEGSARIGAGVGGVVLVVAAFAVASVIVARLPADGRGLTRRRALIVLISPLVGLVALAVLDLVTAHGTGHFTGSVLHARSAGDVRDVIVRRYSAAWDELKNHAMPAATAVALIYAAFGVRRRERLLAPVASDPAWLAALAGGLTAGVVGALVEDSGPVLLVVAVFALGCVATYLWGRPRALAPPTARDVVRAERYVAADGGS
ncbi:MAG: hypothetical protein JWN81_1187 [Solirubrobacterales bacterium]|nr:hypothetical protein [Solirubrobacterales bacterium]